MEYHALAGFIDLFAGFGSFAFEGGLAWFDLEGGKAELPLPVHVRSLAQISPALL